MDPLLVGIIGIVAMLCLLILGAHVAIALALVGIIGLALIVGPHAAVYTSATLAYYKMSNYGLIIIPLFVLMGFLAQGGGMSSNAYESLRLWVGRIKGGLGIATVAACTAFGAVCGSSLVTAAVFAQVSAPEMRRHGYEKKFAYAICSSAGTIGMLIPPSVLMVIYGLLTMESIGKLLIGGIAPGISLFLIFSIGIIVMVSLKPSLVTAAAAKTSWRQRFASLKSLIGLFLAAAVIFGGIFSGVFSPGEAGAVACVILLIMFLASKERSWTSFRTAMRQTLSTSAMVFLILIGAGIFARFLTISTIAPRFLEAITDLGLPPLGFLAISAIVYILLGCFFDSISMLCITLPLLHPAALALGIDPLHFAMVAILAIHVGLITPPLGLNIYAVKGVAEADVSLEELFRGVMPFLLMMLICLAFFVVFPILSTWLPSVMVE